MDNNPIVMDVASVRHPSKGYNGCGHTLIELIGPSVKLIFQKILKTPQLKSIVKQEAVCPVCRKNLEAVVITFSEKLFNTNGEIIQNFVNTVDRAIDFLPMHEAVQKATLRDFTEDEIDQSNYEVQYRVLNK